MITRTTIRTALVAMAFVLAFSAPALAAKAKVVNVRAEQKDSTVVFTYDISSRSPEVNVTVVIDGRSDLSITGDIGKMPVGRGKTITWNVLNDFPDGFSGRINWVIDAVPVEEPSKSLFGIFGSDDKKEEPKKEAPAEPVKKKKKYRPLPSL